MNPENQTVPAASGKVTRAKPKEKSGNDELTPDMEQYLKRMDEELKTDNTRSRLLGKR